MFSAKVPILNERVRLLEENRRNILRQALWARRCEEIVGDYVHLCEDKTDYFQYLNAQLIEQYNAATDLAFRGMIAPGIATSINDHLLEAIEDEIHNLAVQSTLCTLKGTTICSSHGSPGRPALSTGFWSLSRSSVTT